ncbi:hypothetical protein HDU99_000140, partial [Rhizoclosmatium hyalinum]
PDLYGLLDFSTGLSHVFIPRLDIDYEIWCGKIVPPSGYAQRYGIDCVHFGDELTDVLKALGGPIHILSGINSDSKRAIVKVDVQSLIDMEVIDAVLYRVMVESRAIKSGLELDLMRYVNNFASKAHINVMQNCKPGLMEFQLESLFLHYASFEGGSRYSAYTCICGCGPNGAVLHYGHAGAPNSGRIKDGDMCLLDMGAEYHCYASDITCSYPSNGKFTQKQKGIYNAVLDALLAVREAVKEGVEWVEMHLLAERMIVKGLVAEGIVLLGDKTLDQVLDLEIGALFFPHGLGHLMGMDTHDVGGYPQGISRHSRPGLSSLRLNRPLKAGMVLTNEPGCYFIEALLVPALDDPVKGPHLNRDLILGDYANFGGVRLEEDLIITVDGCENMTDVPRTVEDIEAVMSGQAWPSPDAVTEKLWTRTTIRTQTLVKDGDVVKKSSVTTNVVYTPKV